MPNGKTEIWTFHSIWKPEMAIIGNVVRLYTILQNQKSVQLNLQCQYSLTQDDVVPLLYVHDTQPKLSEKCQ